MGISILIGWTLVGFYVFEFFEQRSLFEYITLLLIGLYVSLDIRTEWKYMWLLLLTWNVIDEIVAITFNNYYYLFLVIPIAIYVFKTTYESAVNNAI